MIQTRQRMNNTVIAKVDELNKTYRKQDPNCHIFINPDGHGKLPVSQDKSCTNVFGGRVNRGKNKKAKNAF